MKRHLFNAAAIVSLLLSLAVAALWVRSYWRSDVVGYSLYRVESGFGQLRLIFRKPHGDARNPGWSLRVTPQKPSASDRKLASLMAFHTERLPVPGGAESRLAFPYWVPFTTALAIPCLCVCRRKRGQQDDACCLRCSYNLRGTVGSACPECGAERPTAA